MQTSISLVPVDDLEAEANPRALGKHLFALKVQASGPPALTAYTSLLQACCDAIAPVLGGLHDQGYALWLLLAGAEMTQDRRATYPNYSLFSPAQKLGVEKGMFVEHDFRRDGKIRTAGLYKVRMDQYVSAFEFMTRNSWSFGILSHRADLAILDSLDAIYRQAALDRDGKEMRSLNWLAASALLAPLGDVGLRTLGSSDDKYRCLVLACGRTSAAAGLFAAAVEHAGQVATDQ